MKLSVKGNGGALTEINIRDKDVKKKTPDPVEIIPDSLTEQRELTMDVSKKEGVLKSIKTGITTNFASPFGLALGFSPTIVTLLTAVPQLLGSVSVLFVEGLIKFLHKRKRLMVLSSYLESYTWLLVLVMAILSVKNPWLLIALVTLDAIFINIQYPIWNSIMSDTVPNERLGKYFGIRNLFVGISSLLSVIIAGVVLNKTASFNHPILGFSIIFAAAFISAYTATNYQSKMIDPNPKIKQDSKHSFKEFIFTIQENNFGMYTGFFAMYQMVVNISAPFYTIYMLKVLNFDYLTFTILTTIAAVSSFSTMKIWGKLVDKYGSKKIMSITSFIISISPILWMLSTNWKYLGIVELVSGVLWAGFNISCSTFMFESVKPEHKVKYYTYNKVLYGVGVFLGVMIGIFLYNLPPFIFSSSILFIFLTSGILRFITALIFIPRIQEEKVISINFKSGPFFKQLITLRPRDGSSFMVGGDHKYKKIDEHITRKKEREKITPEKERIIKKEISDSIIEDINRKKDKQKKQIDSKAVNNALKAVKDAEQNRNKRKGNKGNT